MSFVVLHDHRRRRRGIPLSFLLRDDFVTPESAPIGSPRICEPGPGILTFTQTVGQFSIASDLLAFPASASVGLSGAIFQALTRAAGLAIVTRTTIISGSGQHAPATWKADANLSTTVAGGNRWGLLCSNAGTGVYNVASGTNTAVTAACAYQGGVAHNIAIILRNNGWMAYIKGTTAFPEWGLVFLSNQSNNSPVYPILTPSTGALANMDTWRVLQLPAPFDTDTGNATQVVSGSVSAGQNFVHEPETWLDFTVTTLPSSGSISLEFRKLDASNKLRITIGTTGTVTLISTSGGTDTQLGSTGTVIAGNKLHIRMIGTAVTIWYASNSITAHTDSLHQANTLGTLQSLGTGGALSDLVSTPVNAGAEAVAVLDAALAA